MPEQLRLKCQVCCPESGDVWERWITFPFPPFPGMYVGGTGAVKEVLVCQRDLDGDGEIVVRLDDATEYDEQVLESTGWCRR